MLRPPALDWLLLVALTALYPRVGGEFLGIVSAFWSAGAGGGEPHGARTDPDAGLDDRTLTPTAGAVWRLARAHGVAAYELSPGLASDPLTLQRVTEGLWPRRLERADGHLFLLVTEPLPTGCVVKAEERGIRYAVCC